MDKKSYSLPKNKRLCKKSEFDSFFLNAKKIQNKYLIIYYHKASDDQGKVAFVAGKRLGQAVMRNACKRRLREFYRLNQDFITKNYNLVFTAKANILNDKFSQVSAEILNLIKVNNLI